MLKLKHLPTYCVLIAVVLVIVYLANFSHASLSDNTSDWGAWGSYVNVGISLISISLIYITYKEQQKSNKIARFEEHYHVALKTAGELFERKKEIIKDSYNRIENHFRNPFDPLTDYTQRNTKNVLGYYYSSDVFDVQQECDEVFRYFYTALNSIKSSPIIDADEKDRCYTEMSCLFSEEARILLLFWGYNKGIDLSDYYNEGMFRTSIINNEALLNIIKFVCTGERRKNEKINIEDIDLGDNINENFSETYNRLLNNKNKQQ